MAADEYEIGWWLSRRPGAAAWPARAPPRSATRPSRAIDAPSVAGAGSRPPTPASLAVAAAIGMTPEGDSAGAGRRADRGAAAPPPTTARDRAATARLGLSAAAGPKQIVEAYELDPRAARRLAQRRLVGVDRLPARPGDVVGDALRQPAPRSRRRRRGRARRRRASRLGVLDDPGHRVGGVLLVGPDHARRPALDPADDVLARGRRPSSPTTRPASLRIRPAALVEGQPGHGDAAIADRAQHQPALDHLLLAGRLGADAAVVAGDELG